MKVLVTDRLGLIGVETVGVLRDTGPKVVDIDTGYFDECDTSKTIRGSTDRGPMGSNPRRH